MFNYYSITIIVLSSSFSFFLHRRSSFIFLYFFILFFNFFFLSFPSLSLFPFLHFIFCFSSCTSSFFFSDFLFLLQLLISPPSSTFPLRSSSFSSLLTFSLLSLLKVESLNSLSGTACHN